MPLPPLLVGAAAVGQQIGNWIQGRSNVDKTIEQQKAMAELEWKRSLEMWNKQNEYNAPEAQMERLRQAGLNPNLVYGSGSATATAAPATMPKYNAPTPQYNYPAPGIADMLSQYQDFTIKQATTNNAIEQNRILKAEAEYADKKQRFTAGLLSQKHYYGSLLGSEKVDQERMKTDFLEQSYPYQLQYQSGKVSQQELQRTLSQKQADSLDQKIQYQTKVNDFYLTKMWADLIAKGVGTVGNLLPSGKLGKAIGGSFNQSKRVTPPRYNSMESWRQAGY